MNRICPKPQFRLPVKNLGTTRPLLQLLQAPLTAAKGTTNATAVAASTTGSAVTVSVIALKEMTRLDAVSLVKHPFLISYGLVLFLITTLFRRNATGGGGESQIVISLGRMEN